MSIYNIKVKKNNGEEVSMKEYEGKVLLIVNTASKCGFTPQYEELQALYGEYESKGLEILAFPCNQFGKQEQGSDAEIASFCDLSFKTTFPLFSKVEVNGSDASELYEYLKEEAKGLLGSKKIKWNFTKFLVDRSGKVLKRYAPQIKPLAIKEDIEKVL